MRRLLAAADHVRKAGRSGGAKASLLGTTKRADGRLQVTYNHHPLYTFVKDTRKGQTNGEEINAFGAEWYALSPAGTKVENSQAKSNSITATTQRRAVTATATVLAHTPARGPLLCPIPT